MLRYEAWTLPWMGDFKRKVARLPDIEGTGNGSIQLFTTAGSGNVDLALGRWDRLDEVISETESSLIRVYDQYDVIDEWISQRVTRQHSDNNKVASISGNSLPWIFDRYLIPPFDTPANPSVQPNWNWGGTNLLGNPGLEDSTSSPTIYELTIEATAGTYTLSDGTDTTLPIAFDAAAGTIATRIQTDLGFFNDVVVAPAGLSPRKFVITYVDPPFGVFLTVNGASLTPANSATLARTSTGSLSTSPWTIAQTLGSAGGFYTTFTVTDVRSHSGLYSLEVNPGPSNETSNRWPGAQQIVSITPGLAQASIWVYPTSASDTFQLQIRGIGEEVIAYSVDSALTVNNWNQITITDFIIPDGTTQVIFRLYNTNAGPHDPAPFFLDDAELYLGMPPSTPGDILTLLMAAHSGLSLWIDTSSFDDTTDSNGTPWVAEITFEAQWGEHYGHILDRFVDLTFEWWLQPKATPVGTLTHDLFFYVEGGRDSDPSTGVNVKQGITGGQAAHRTPDFTEVTVEGAGGAYTVLDNPTTLADFGLMQTFTADRALLDEETRTLRAQALLNFEEANRNAVQVEVFRSSLFPIPMVTYRPGDTIPFQLPPGLPKEERRVQRIDYTNTYPVTYSVTGSRLLTGEAAAYDLLWRMWRRFNRPKEPMPAPPPGNKGGQFTIQIAHPTSTPLSQAKADIISGLEDAGGDILASCSSLATSLGEVHLAEGTYPTFVKIVVPAGVKLTGRGRGTHIDADVPDDWAVEGRTGAILEDFDCTNISGSGTRLAEVC